MTPTDNLGAGAGDLVAQKLRERAVFMREAGHDDDADLDLDAAAQLAAVTAENARLRERIEQAYKAGFDFAMMTEAPK